MHHRDQADPSDTEALSAMGTLHFERKAYAEAERFLSQALVHSPDDPSVLSYLAWLSFLAGDLGAAEKRLLVALDHDPNDALAHFRLGRVYWSMGGDKRTDKAYAHIHLLKAAKIDPT